MDGSADLVSRDEREVNFSVELGTGVVLPGGKLTLSYGRKWDHRGRRFLNAVEGYADANEDELVQRIEEDGRFGDLLAVAAQKVVLIGDDEIQDWLARLVAGAFLDDAKVDEIAFLIDLLAHLSPAHLRVMRGVVDLPPLSRQDIEAQLNMPPALVQAAVARLEADGLIAAPRAGGFGSPTPEYQLTDLGKTMLSHCEGVALRLRDRRA
jgi:hypothetical protein